MTRRVAASGVMAVCFTALLVGVIAYVLVARDVRSSEDRVLSADAAHPAAALGARTTYSQLAQLSSADGLVVRTTQALRAIGGLEGLPRRGFANVTVAGRHLRVDTVRVHRRFFLSVAVSDAPARTTLRRLRVGIAVAAVVAALMVSLALIWLARRALGPVVETAAVADRIVQTGDLTERVPQATGQDEIAQLSRSINRMLDHLEDSDAALRRLVADASHELRSPVTTLRGNLDLLATAAMSSADRAEALADARAEAERLGDLVEALLTLARADTVAASERLQLDALIAEAIAGTGAQMAAPAARASGGTVNGDPVALRAMVRNLVENADRYGGGAEVHLDGDDRWLRISIRDHGPGVPDHQKTTVFSRFNRGANSAGVSGSGLGLAIVAAVARSQGGAVELSDTPGGGATFTVSLPRSDPADG